MRANFLFLASFASLPLLSAAQTAPASPPYYVGVNAAVLTNIGFRTGAYSPFAPDPTLVGPALTLGRQLSAHWSAQIGLAYGWRTVSDTTTYAGAVTTRTRLRLVTVPLLLRYSFSPIASRFHLDALGGLTLQHATSSFDYNYTDFPPSRGGTFDNSGQYTSTSAHLTLGPAVRFALVPHLELTAMPLLNVALNKNEGDLRQRLRWNAQVGVNYLFGH